jgi:anti-sigma regulatory factor (Ser/Thr protein kinase)
VTGHTPFEPAGDRVALPIRAPHDLAWARRLVIDTATRIGINSQRAAHLALAVTEIATNALVHADAAAHIEIMAETDRVVVVISDQGSGLPATRHFQLPPPVQTGGRGLWLAERLCDRLEVLPALRGTRIALTTRC